MEILKIGFPVSGVETWLFIPPLVTFLISFFTSMAGISEAFLLLPFQMSVLGFTGPAVTSTNFLYNVVGVPGGVLRYIRERRMVWPLAWCIISGTLPGVLIGYYLRVKYFPDPRVLKFFVGMVLLCIGYRLLKGNRKRKLTIRSTTQRACQVNHTSFTFTQITFSFMGETFCFSIPAIFFPALLVGIISGIYGIGGGAIIAPFCVSVLHIPVFTVAGAVLFANFMTSLAGIFFYSTIPFVNGHTAPPDWLLGLLFGMGGLGGTYLGAKCQKYTPEEIIRFILALIVFTVSVKYIGQFF